MIFSALPVTAEEDPFSEIKPHSTSAGQSAGQSTEEQPASSSWSERFFSDNFGFRKELMSEFGTTGPGHLASRQSIGFETLKKFSTEIKTFLSVDFQARLVRRDGFVESANDIEGMHRTRWTFETHNAYADLYDLFGDVGRFNARIGRFYVPFGLNLQTDTHGTVLQLSNERNFGFERDWYVGFWGILSEDLLYDAYYLVGSGHGLKFGGQSGLLATRLSLANKYSSEYGLEAGLSLIGGQRFDSNTTKRVDTLRAGLDGRYRKAISTGLLTWLSELSAGRDSSDAFDAIATQGHYPTATQVHQLDYLHSSRRFGLATQYRWFWQNRSTESSALAEATWYFQNDVGNSSLHWIKLNCEYQLARQKGGKNVIGTLQYYLYW